MAIISFRSKRNGIEKIGVIGQENGVGKTYRITTDPDDKKQLRKKEGFLKIEILFLPVKAGGKLESELLDINTVVGEAYISPNGEIVSDVTECPFQTNAFDKAAFTRQLADLIYRFGWNGKVRAYERHNDKPIFYSADVKDELGNIIHHAGEVITYTEEQENEAPQGGYYPAVEPQDPPFEGN